MGVLLLLLALETPAAGHSVLTSSQPRSNQTLAQPPSIVEMDYTEPPTGDASVSVTDGCGDDVVSEIEVQNNTVTTSLAKGGPGRWRVRFAVVSGVDGHATKGGFSFEVEGKRDCPRRAAGPRPEPEANSSFVLWLTLGGLALLAAILGTAYLSTKRRPRAQPPP